MNNRYPGFFSKFVAMALIAVILLPGTVQSSVQTEEQRASKLIEEFERIHADISGTKQRAHKAQLVALDYAEQCEGKAAACNEALVEALIARGYPEVTIRNLQHLIEESKRIGDMRGATDTERVRLLKAIFVKYPVAMPTAEAYSGTAIAWSWVGGIVAGTTMIIWGIKDHRRGVFLLGIGVIIGVTAIAVSSDVFSR
jgi:hypothetical protein